jgi:hypothetical protein
VPERVAAVLRHLRDRMGSSRSNRDNGALGVRPKREAPDLRAGGWGVPLELRGASGALDKEPDHRNLPLSQRRSG